MSRNSAQIGRVLKELSQPCEGVKCVINRNPRNLERLRIAYKPSGYHLEKPGHSFWHKLEIKPTGRYVTAEIRHFKAGPVLTASTSEWAIKKQLYKTKDTTAYINLARVLAQRCLQAGITEFRCDIKPVPNGKTEIFLKTLEANGVTLEEPERFQPHRSWDMERPEKPWEITE